MSFLRLVFTFGSAALFAISSLASAQEVTVKPGDTLWALAQRYNTTIDAILEVNGLTGSDLMPGAVLKLPGDATAQPQTFTVRAGDTLYDVAVAFNISVDELIAINKLEGSRILVGQVLVVKPGANTADTTALEQEPEPLVITVKAGDTLYALAARHDVTVDAISEANGLSRGNILKPGDALTIPGRYAGSGADLGGVAAPVITVVKGESLWSIAQRYNTTVAALMSTNGLTSATVNAGQSLRIVASANLLPATTTAPQAALGQATMVWPLKGQITSRFGYRRLRVSGSNYHTGLDIDGRTGDPIVSATSGVVTFSGWRGGYGNVVIVETGGTEYFYAHASELLVAAGTIVHAGQLVARVGNTGHSFGSHLHFEVRVAGSPVDPLELLEHHATR